jgi:hypothetical protein
MITALGIYCCKKERMNMKSTCSLKLCLIGVLACLLLGGLCSAQVGKVINQTNEVDTEEEAYITGLQGYLYGFPLVLMNVTNGVMTAAPNAGQYRAPINQLGRMRTYVIPEFKDVVRISRSGLWTWAVIDLGKEPLVLSNPDTNGRYFVMQMMNMWTDDYGSVGSRTNGSSPGNYLIAGYNWNGTVPEGINQTFRSSTRYGWVLIQTMCNGTEEYPEVNAIQDQYQLTPLSAWGTSYTPPTNVPVDPSVDTKTLPPEQVHQMDAATFFQQLAMLMEDNPPYPADAPMLQKLKEIGVEPGKDFNISALDPAVARGLNRSVKDGWVYIQISPYLMDPNNGWNTENGWITFKNMGNWGTHYGERAIVAMFGLGAATWHDVVYPTAFVDGNGSALDGANKYVLHLEKDAQGQIFPLKDNASWSISVYRDNYYVKNSINRYALAPWMPLKYNEDGSLDVYLQPDSPGPDKESNWLPSPPRGPISVTIRVYQPQDSLINNSFIIPPLVRLAGNETTK